MHLVVIAWLYVALMMAVAEATNSNGTVLGAVFTFLLYGLAPVALVTYLLATPARRRAQREQEERERAAASTAPDAGGEAPADAISPIGKKP
jgi:membrane protein implicated in regulation of membrane protease activity